MPGRLLPLGEEPVDDNPPGQPKSQRGSQIPKPASVLGGNQQAQGAALPCKTRIPLAFIAKRWVFRDPMVIHQSQGPLTGKTVKGKKNLLTDLVVSYRELGLRPREIRRRRVPLLKVISHLQR